MVSLNAAMLDQRKNMSINAVSAIAAKSGGLCFDKAEFMKTNFSVDEFLHKNRNVPSLEQLRDDLGLYLKGLRSSMIDLINEDYADFVSLSANLVGLDGSIEAIQQPLEQFRTEIESIQTLIKENESEIRDSLELKRNLRILRRNLESLKKVYETMAKLEDLLKHQLSDDLRAVDLERAALELVQLKFNEKFCSEYLTEEHKDTIRTLQQQVLERLRVLFNDVLKTVTSTSTEQLERCLRIYITLDSCHVAEQVFCDDVVSPYMNDVISEQSLQNSPQGLAGVYSRILNFISLHMTDLLRLTQYTDKLRGFQFVINSFWVAVGRQLETNMTSIFAPGNAEIFYVKYKCTRNFLSKIEELLASDDDVQVFRQHTQTKSFETRWNLPVYFQICFQDIAGKFEGTLDPIIREDILKQASTADDFRIVTFTAAHNAIERCWAEGVFLPEVFPRFFKLTVQIVLRLSTWISEVINVSTDSKAVYPAKLNRNSVLVALHADILKLNKLLLDLQDQILLLLPKDKQDDIIKQTIEKSLANLEEVLCQHLQKVQNALVDILIGECGLENVRQVNDLPRLYRKTNREVPTRSSGYVELILRPLKVFTTHNEAILGKEVVVKILSEVITRITTVYFTAVSDVLTSVQKTEESLRRLKNLKSSSSPASTVSTQTQMSDDDKIRLQLRVDVTAWREEIVKLNLSTAHITKLNELINIVEDSIKAKDVNTT